MACPRISHPFRLRRKGCHPCTIFMRISMRRSNKKRPIRLFGQAFFRYDLVVSLLSSPGGFSNHQRGQLLRPNVTHVLLDTAPAAGVHVDGVFSHLPAAPDLFLSFESVKHNRITQITGFILHLNSDCFSSYIRRYLTASCKNALIRALAGSLSALLWAFFAGGIFVFVFLDPAAYNSFVNPDRRQRWMH